MPRVGRREVKGSGLFNGTSSIATIVSPASDFALTSNFTASCFFKVNNVVSGTRRFMAKNNTGGWAFGHNTSGKLLFTSLGVIDMNDSSSYVIPVGRWQHATAVYDTTGCSFYINGEFLSRVAGAAPTGVVSGFTVGGRSGTEFFSGNLCMVRVQNRALTAQEVKNLFYADVAGLNTVGLYYIDEMSGSTLIDSSGRGNNLTSTAITYTTEVPTRSARLLQEDRCSLNFVNATDNITLPSISGIDVSTFSYWSRIKVIGSGSLQTIVGPADGVTNVPLWRVNASGFLELTKHGVSIIGTATTALNKGQWYDVGVTYNGVTGAYVFYANGQIVGSGTNLQTFSFSARQLGTHGTGTESFVGRMCDFGVANTVLTQQEMLNITNGILPTSTVVNYALNTGAGTIAYDGATANNGTITGATWNVDKMFGGKKQVNGNLVKNGDLSYVPVVNVPTTTTDRFIDGTTSGSTSNALFGWSHAFTGSGSAMFDTSNLGPTGKPSLKLSTLAIGSKEEAFIPSITNTHILYWGKTKIEVLPSTRYNYSFWMKTNYVSGDSSEGCSVRFITSNASGLTDGGSAVQSPSTVLKTTTDWTYYSGTFTTTSTSKYVQCYPRISGSVGAGTLIMDAWFSDIQLRPTSPLVPNTRKQVGGNMVYNGNLQYVPASNTPQTTTLTYYTGAAAGSATQSEFGYTTILDVAPCTVLFDTSVLSSKGNPMIKIDCTSTLARGRVTQGSGLLGTGATISLANLNLRPIKVQPNTSYTVSFEAIGLNLFTTGNGVGFHLMDSTGTRTSAGAYASPIPAGTTPLTKYTVSFITGANDAYLVGTYGINTAGSIQTLWVGEIYLTETTPITRTAVV